MKKITRENQYSVLNWQNKEFMNIKINSDNETWWEQDENEEKWTKPWKSVGISHMNICVIGAAIMRTERKRSLPNTKH